MSEPTAVSTCPRRRVLSTVSGSVPGDLAERIAAGRRPRADYVEMAAAMDAELLDRSAVERALGRPGRLIARFVGPDVMMAVVVFRRRREHDVVVTDGEQVGMPLAALLRLVPRAKAPRHIMIGHRISTRAKRLAFSLGGLRRRIDRVVLYSSAQTAVALDDLGLPLGAVVEIPFMVDAEFFRPDVVTATASARPLVGTAGLELRDYPTLVRPSAASTSVSSSPLPARGPSERLLRRVDLPSNVEVSPTRIVDLRELYAAATLSSCRWSSRTSRPASRPFWRRWRWASRSCAPARRARPTRSRTA